MLRTAPLRRHPPDVLGAVWEQIRIGLSCDLPCDALVLFKAQLGEAFPRNADLFFFIFFIFFSPKTGT